MSNEMNREEKLAELLKNFVEREISFHEPDDQPYSIDWVLIGQAEEALGETFKRRWGKALKG